MNYYQFHISDWVLHTSHLTLEEEAVYRRLLDHYYDTEQPIPEGTQPVIRRLRLGSYSDMVALILGEFFALQEDGWHNLRADSEIIEYQAKAERARQNGKKGGRPKKQKQHNQQVTENKNPEETQPVISRNPEETGSKANHKPLTINQDNKKHKFDSIEQSFGAFWENYPKKENKKKSFIAFKRLSVMDRQKAILDCWQRYRDTEKQFIPLATTYLHGERWNDELPSETKQSQFNDVDYGEAGAA